MGAPGVPEVEGARQPMGGIPLPGTVENPLQHVDDRQQTLLASIRAHFKTLGMEGDAGTSKLKREWICGRFLGAGVKLAAAPVDALTKLDAELGRLVDLRKQQK